MEMTTIAVTKDIRDKISEFGNKGETFSDILSKLIKSAEQRLLHDILMSKEGCISLDEFEREVNEKWPKSK